MSGRKRGPAVVPMRIFLISSAASAAGALLLGAGRLAAARREMPRDVVVTVADPHGQPIAREAAVFRTRPQMLAIDPTGEPRGFAHPRSLATYRALRAYAGAPPRIPHGLTPAEFQTGGCRTCHERGGFSQRFGAYVPVTPHPEMGACLQCHVGDAQLMAIPLPGLDPNARCRQCHAPGARRWADSSVHWVPLEWPRVNRTVPGQPPPVIPHPLDMRANCLTCHAPPSGVAEIRTTHPERANCRQCHLTEAAGDGDYLRPARASVAGTTARP